MKLLLSLLLLPALVLAVYDYREVQLGNWGNWFYNDGRWGINIFQGSGVAGGYWRDSSYVFGAGVWVGGIPDGDTLVTNGYDPNSGGTEFYPTPCLYWRQGENDPRDRIYMFPGDWPPPPNRFPWAPQYPTGDIMLWSCSCDSYPDNHRVPGVPIGIDLYVTVYYVDDSLGRDIYLMRYEAINRHGADLDSIYFGMCIDADVGNAADDMSGLILNKLFNVNGETLRVRDAGFAWSSDGQPSGAVGVRVLRSPTGVGLSAFRRFSLNNDPVTDVAQYLALTGHDWWPPYEYNPYDSLDYSPEDKRFLLSTGPFDLPADSLCTAWYAVAAAPFSPTGQPQPGDTNELALRLWYAEHLLEQVTAVAEPRAVPTTAGFRVSPSILRPGRTVLLTGAGKTSVEVFDASGRLARRLAGQAAHTWDGTDSRGRALPAGVYFLQAGSQGSARVQIVPSRR
jgi:hypothetical protein